MKVKDSRAWSFATIALIYAAATLLALYVWKLCSGIPVLWSLFIADAAATVFVWAWGLVFRNVSVYDPYWSVAPPVLLTILAAVHGAPQMSAVLAIAAVWIWAIRLTANWAYTFHGLSFEDWRYTKYRTEQHPVIFQAINFFGLNMMPTVVVYLAMLPAISLVLDGTGNAGVLTWAGFSASIGAAAIQFTADRQAHAFRKDHRGQVCRTGLWKNGRHPNYFGEILMWWGVWLMYVSVEGITKANWWYVCGAVAMTLMFRFISVPLMERRQLANKPDYAAYKASTRMFI